MPDLERFFLCEPVMDLDDLLVLLRDDVDDGDVASRQKDARRDVERANNVHRPDVVQDEQALAVLLRHEKSKCEKGQSVTNLVNALAS